MARVEVLILFKHGTCHSRRQRGSQASKRIVSDVISLSAVRVRLRQLVRADTHRGMSAQDGVHIGGTRSLISGGSRRKLYATSGMVIGLGYFLLGTAPAYSESICSAQREARALDLASRHRYKAARLLEMRTPQVASSTNDEGGMTKSE